MKLLFHLLNLLCVAILVSGSALPAEHHPEHHHDSHEARYDSHCDFARAYSILQGLSDGKSYCYSHIYPHGVPTRTVGTTVTVTGSKCRTRTKTVSESVTYSDEIYVGSPKLSAIELTEYASTVVVPTGNYPSINKRVLPRTTITEYASTVLVPTGTYPVINKRAPMTVPPKTTINPAPTALSQCDPDDCSRACYSLYKPSTTTKTFTRTEPCRVIETSTTLFTFQDDTTFYVTETPPAVTTTVTDILTTTVPAACAGLPYDQIAAFDGSEIEFEQYPAEPHSDIACCTYCFAQLNCAASYWDYLAQICEVLVRTGTAVPGASPTCPLGISDYEFGAPDAAGHIFPGPCGK